MARLCRVKGKEKPTARSITTAANSISSCLMWNPSSVPLRGQTRQLSDPGLGRLSRPGPSQSIPPPTAADDVTSHPSCTRSLPIRVQETTGGFNPDWLLTPDTDTLREASHHRGLSPESHTSPGQRFVAKLGR